MKGKTKTILTVIIAILIFATAVVGTVTFLKDDGEASAAEEGVGNVLPVTGSDDEQVNPDGEQNPTENLDGEENPEEQPGEVGDSEEGTTGEGEITTGTTGTVNQGTTVGGQTEPAPTTIEQERLVSTTLNWSSISLNSTIGETGINYTKSNYVIEYYKDGELIKTEPGKEDHGKEVTVTEEQIKDNCPDGYKLDEEKSELSVTLTENEEENVIEVHYVKDESQTKDLSYTVEYYKDGNIVFKDCYGVPSIVWVNDPDTLTVGTIDTSETKYTGYKLAEQDTFKLNDEVIEAIPETVTNGDVIKVYYVKDETQQKELSYTVEYYRDGKKVEEDSYTTEPVKVWVNDPNTLTVGTIDTSETKYTGYKLAEQDTFKLNDEVIEAIPETVTNEDVIKVYYVKDETQQKELSYTVEYYKDGNKVEADSYTTEPVKVWVNDPNTLTVGTIDTSETKYTGYKLAEQDTFKLNDEVIEAIPETVTNEDVIKVYYVKDETQQKELSYTVEYYKDGNKVEADSYTTEPVKVWVNDPNTLTVGTVDTSATKYTGYKLAEQDTFKLNDEVIEAIPETVTNEDVIKVYYVKDSFEYTVEYYYEKTAGGFGAPDENASYTKSAKYQDVVTYEPKDQNGTYVLFKVETAGVEGKAELTVTENKNNNIIKVYYERNSYDYKVVYYQDSVSDANKLGETEAAEQKLGTVMTSEIIATDLENSDWKNAYKSELEVPTGYNDGEVEEYITIEANDNNVINVVYTPKTIGYTVNYYFNNEIDTTGKNYSETATYGTEITATDYSNNGEWELDTTKLTDLTFTIGATNNVFEVYYVKPDITVEKTRTVNTNRTNGAENTVEPGETITYTIKATNNGYKDGTVKIGDGVPEGTTLYGDITVIGYTTPTVTPIQLDEGIVLTVPAKQGDVAGTASVTFTVTVTANAGSDVVNMPEVNDKDDTNNTVTNPVEKTVSVKAQTETITGTNVVLLLDTSGSMDGSKLSSAKTEAVNLINKVIPADGSSTGKSTISVIEFGGHYEYDSILGIIPVDYSDHAILLGTATNKDESANLITRVNSLNAEGDTPINLALSTASTLIGGFSNGNKNVIILLSDGAPTDSGYNTTATNIKNAGTTIYTIGFGTDASTNTTLSGIASPGCAVSGSDLSSSFNAISAALSGDPVPTQSTDGLIELTGVYVTDDNKHPISITVNGVKGADINTLPTETTDIANVTSESGRIIYGNDGNYYLNLKAFEAGDEISISYCSNTSSGSNS